jgi:hypothetical protein
VHVNPVWLALWLVLHEPPRLQQTKPSQPAWMGSVLVPFYCLQHDALAAGAITAPTLTPTLLPPLPAAGTTTAAGVKCHLPLVTTLP